MLALNNQNHCSNKVCKNRFTMSVMLFVSGVFFVIIEYCRFGCLREYVKDHQDDFLETMDDDCKRDAAKAKQEDQPRIPSYARCVNVTPGSDARAEFTTGATNNMAPLTTKDLVCYLFQIARGMEFLASRKVGDIWWKDKSA